MLGHTLTAHPPHCHTPQICKELSLDFGWFDAINTYMQMRLDEFVEVGGTWLCSSAQCPP